MRFPGGGGVRNLTGRDRWQPDGRDYTLAPGTHAPDCPAAADRAFVRAPAPPARRAFAPGGSSSAEPCRYREQVAATPGAAAQLPTRARDRRDSRESFIKHEGRGDFPQAGPDRSRSAPGAAASGAEDPDPFVSLRRDLPTFIRACSANPDPLKPVFWLHIWDPENPSIVTRAPYSCRSWRCPFGCAVHESHVLWTRMNEAFGDAEPHEMASFVLTLDSPFHDLGDHTLDSLYRELGWRLEKFRKRLRRFMARQGLEPFGNSWVAVVEQHRSGVPHVNLLMRSRSFCSWLTTRYLAKRRAGLSAHSARLLGGTSRHADAVDRELLSMLSACGFGFRSSAEVARNRDAMIGYIGKIAGNADTTAHRVAHSLARVQGRIISETTKRSQLPIRAPKGFRRLRSGIHFIPPRRKGDKTGMLIKRYRRSNGDEIAMPLVQAKRPDLVAMQDLICAAEQSHLAWKDEELRERAHKLRGLRLPWKPKRRDLITQYRVDLSPQSVPPEPPLHFARAGPGPPARERAGAELAAQQSLPGVCVGVT